MTQTVKSPPNSKPSEMMVLGCMLTNESSFKVAADMLDDDDFYYNEHKLIFRVLKSSYKQGLQVDTHLIAEELKRLNLLSAIGGVGYLTTLAQYAGTSANIEEYASIVHNKALLRRMIDTAETIKSEAISEPNDHIQLIEKAQRQITAISQRHTLESGSSIGEIFSGAKSRDSRRILDKLHERHAYFKEHGRPFLTGLSTGFVDLDEKTTILEPMNLIVIAGRPAMGKTALALNIANNVCLDQNKPVGFISLEMSKEQLTERLLSMHTHIPGETLKRGSFENRDLSSLEQVISKLTSTPLFILDSRCTTIGQVVSNVRRLKDKQDIQLLVIDYLQLLSVDGGGDSRQYEVAEISRRLKLLAMELQIPIIAIAQLSRKVEERVDKRPMLSDLRDSGQIEQDADVAVFVYRRDYYDKNDKPGQADILVRKNRNGDEAEVSLAFDKGSGKFNNLASPNKKAPSSIKF